jgi:23S rRNA pseudouridine1911/1915/1917 synthase
MVLTYIVERKQGFNDFLKALDLPTKLVKSVLSKKLITINGLAKAYFQDVDPGDCVQISLPEETIDDTISHEAIPLDILFEDVYLLIVNKPYGMPVMVTKSHPTGTLSNALCHYYSANHINSKIHLVNRLDKDTSGLMVVAKNRYIKYLLSEDLRLKLHREYYALVEGVFDSKAGTIDLPIGKPEALSMHRAIMDDGDEAVTDYRVDCEFSGKSLLAITLRTGRTHQIRVHMAHLGHPIIGDMLYNPNHSKAERMMLSSHMIRFIHPITKIVIQFDLGLSDEFRNCLNQG